MPATLQNISHPVGDSAVIVLGPVTEVDGSYSDLAGATARWWMGKNVKATGTDVYVKKSTADVTMEIVAETDRYKISIPLLPADTEGKKAGTFYHECEVVYADGSIATVTTGEFTLVATLIPDAI